MLIISLPIKLPKNNFGFVSDKGTTDAIIMLLSIIEKNSEVESAKQWILFVDHARAFFTKGQNALWIEGWHII